MSSSSTSTANKKRPTLGSFLLLIFAVNLYATSGYFSKMSSFHSFLSLPYILYFVCVVAVLGAYAVLWQLTLKRMPLSLAYPFKAFGIVVGLAIAYFAFDEALTWQNIIGSLLVISGLVIMSTGK